MVLVGDDDAGNDDDNTPEQDEPGVTCEEPSVSETGQKKQENYPNINMIKTFNFYPLKVVSRYRDPQIQVGENYSYL